MTSRQVLLKDVCEISMGQAPKGTSYNTTGEGHPLIAGAGDFGEVSPQPKKYTTEPTRLSRVDDIILCIRATIGDRNWSDSIYCLGRGVAGLRANPDQLDQKYLWHWLGSTTPQLRSQGRGATFLQVNRADISSMQIPLPPLPEQRRIAAILDQADALRAKRRQAIAKLDALLQSVFLEMFGDPVTNPKGWSVTSMDSITDTRLGKMLDKRTRQGDHMRPYLANRNVQWGRFVLTDLGTMNFDPADQEEFALQPGDLLMCEGGEPGRCAIWRGQLEDCYFQKALHRVRCHTEKCLPEYLLWLFWFLAQAGAFRSSIAVATIAHLPGVKLKKLRVPVPTLDRQQQFARMCAQIDNTKERLLAGGSLQNSLMASLQHESFAGSV